MFLFCNKQSPCVRVRVVVTGEISEADKRESGSRHGRDQEGGGDWLPKWDWVTRVEVMLARGGIPKCDTIPAAAWEGEWTLLG